ncbi:hypothetical protein [Methylocystis sp. ATCC 49242]|uniref:hypothetical protein n=1 Tax=Methylocystis sp. ATCC 49242 TaxID=622637 RepID=UPI0002EBA489|nr:hypothetical protein [Methylocystis sp. ATCC 49242]
MRPTLASFVDSLEGEAPPPLTAPLRALWLDAKGDWDGAHKCVDELSDPDAMWVHAYLHRKEGDQWNAGYWYRRAGRPPHRGPLDEEWRELVTALVGKDAG